jgi:membrane protease YdiL (CAAX protease family)
MDTKNESARNTYLNVLLLSVLLLFRLTDYYLFNYLNSLVNNGIKDWLGYYYYSIVYVLISIVIWVNRDSLQDMHIDKTFMNIFIVAGLWLSLYSFRNAFGIIPFIATLITIRFFKGQNFRFGQMNKDYRFLLLIILLVLIPFTPYLILSIARQLPMKLDFDTVLNNANLPALVYEEVLFRGILWMLLRNINLSERKTFYIQAILFSVSHTNYLSSPVTFWLVGPMLSLLLGVIVWRLKSLTPSIVVHFLYNFLSMISSNLLH